MAIKYPYIWAFCGFAALGACLYGYDGVYFNGVSTLGMFPAIIAHLRSQVQTSSFATSGSKTMMVTITLRRRLWPS